jgi:hypothetical protein
MPQLRNAQAMIVHGRCQRAQALSVRPSSIAAQAKAKLTLMPT